MRRHAAWTGRAGRGTVLAAIVLAGATACQIVGPLVARDYIDADGRHLLIGQTEPPAAYACVQVARRKQPWGLRGHLDEVAALERMRTEALRTMASLQANYAYLAKPSSSAVLGVNVNAFRSASIRYYRCDHLPAPPQGQAPTDAATAMHAVRPSRAFPPDSPTGTRPCDRRPPRVCAGRSTATCIDRSRPVFEVT